MAPMLINANPSDAHAELELEEGIIGLSKLPPIPITKMDERKSSHCEPKEEIVMSDSTADSANFSRRRTSCQPSIDVGKINLWQQQVGGVNNGDLMVISPCQSERKSFLGSGDLTISPATSERAFVTGNSAGNKEPNNHKRSNSTGAPRAPPNCLKSLQAKLAFRRNKHGETHPSVGVLWNQIGNLHFRSCKFENALEAYKQAVRCDSGEHLAAAYANIGTVYWTTGSVEKSINFLTKALDVYEFDEITEGRNPEESAKMATASYQIGLALILDHQLDKAMNVLKKAQRIQERIHGKNCIPVARTIDAIGRIHQMEGDFVGAIMCHEKALRIKEKYADDSCRSTIAVSLSNIAAAHYAGNNLEEALATYKKVLKLQKAELARCKTDKIKHLISRTATEVGETLSLMGDLCILLRDKAEAERCYKETLLVYREAGLKDDDPRVASLLAP